MNPIELAGGRAGREMARQEQPGWETVSDELSRARFENASDPKIAQWAEYAIRAAGGNAAKAQIVASVPVESAGKKKWELNAEIGQAMEDKLVGLGVPESNIHIFIEAMNFQTLGILAKGAPDWEEVQKRLARATDANGDKLLASKTIGQESVQALVDARSLDEFTAALAALGKEEVYFPNMKNDEVVTWLYDEMRKTTVKREKEKLGKREESGPSWIKKPAPPRKYAVPEPDFGAPDIPLPEWKSKPHKTELPVDWADWKVTVPFSKRGMGEGWIPPIGQPDIRIPDLDEGMRRGNLSEAQKKEAYRLKNVNDTIGFEKPLWNPGQALNLADAFRNGGAKNVLNDAFAEAYWHKMAEFGYKTADEVYKASKQWEFYKRWEPASKTGDYDELSIFGSLPASYTPIILTLPGMRGMEARIYNGMAIGCEYAKRWMLPRVMQGKSFKGSVTLDAGLMGIFSRNKLFGTGHLDENDPAMARIYKSIFSNPLAADKKLSVAATTFGNDMSSLDVLDSNLPLPKLNVRLNYRYEPADRSMRMEIGLMMRPVSMAFGKWPTSTFNVDLETRRFENIFGSVWAGISAGFNINAMNDDHLRGEVSYDSGISGLPVLTGSYEYARNFYGGLGTYGAKAQGDLGDWLGLGQMGYFANYFYTRFPNGGQGVGSLQFGITLSGKTPIKWTEMEMP